MPNLIAYFMLILWPVICVALFRRFGVERAIVWSLLGAYLLLPPRATFDLPLVPDFDKTSIPSICAVLCCIQIAKERAIVLPTSRIVRLLLFVFVAGTIPTVLTNSDPIIFYSIFGAEPVSFATSELPGLKALDMFSVLSSQIIVLIPFVLGWALLSSEKGLRELLLGLVVGGVIYAFPALFEIRLSPQLNIWIYGFFQHDFEQMIRGDGFRPIVFLPHALWISFFFMTALVSAAVLYRNSDRDLRPRLLAAMCFLVVVLYLCKSLAPMLYGLALTPLILVASPKMQIRVAVGFATVAILYPVLRDYNLIPLDKILEWAEAISPARAQSLGYRFDNEEQLLERAHEKWLFGWGGWGRNLIRDLYDGDILSIPDGEWIIVFGTFGWVGYLSKMGLLSAPLIMLWMRMKKTPPSAEVAGLSLILAITLVDMLINAILTPYTWLIAGAILGYCERDQRQEKAFTKPNKPLRPMLS